jgi:4-carboxymuconolactone decarboxylase
MSKARDRGQQVYAQVFGHERRKPSGPDESFDALTLDHLFANIWSRPDLAIRDRSLVTVAILATLGRDELRAHVAGLRNQGFSRASSRNS